MRWVGKETVIELLSAAQLIDNAMTNTGRQRGDKMSSQLKADASGNGSRFFAQKQHVQMEVI
jgi:hypothetical protein